MKNYLNTIEKKSEIHRQFSNTLLAFFIDVQYLIFYTLRDKIIHMDSI